MPQARFIMVGGFLGAGKTTTIARLAQAYQQQGLNVGIVTNDQATDLVDTNSLRSQGYAVGEVAGSCFCCNFNALTDTVERLGQERLPDVILAEPVGSCTDLVATVVQPLLRMYGNRFDVAPYGVILKPSHGKRILGGGGKAGFSHKAEYIFLKQLEEADFILLNRIDELPAAEVDEIAGLIEARHPGTPLLRVSAHTGQGIDALLEFLEQRGNFGRRILELDYDIYAEGEAELGWLNSSLEVAAAQPFALDDLLLDIVRRLQTSLSDAGAETAHLKAIGMSEGAYGVVNLVSSFTQPELSLPSRSKVRHAQVVVNARVALDPESLTSRVLASVDAACANRHAQATPRQTQSFRPGRPVPTYRFAEAQS